jgi:hypothetical protein
VVVASIRNLQKGQSHIVPRLFQHLDAREKDDVSEQIKCKTSHIADAMITSWKLCTTRCADRGVASSKELLEELLAALHRAAAVSPEAA